ncbi:MAG: YdcF family protein [Coraliomargaritaceae bacterium]
MSYYQRYLKHYQNLNFHISQILEWIKNNRIDYIFHSLISAESEINFIKPYLLEISALDLESVEDALNNIQAQKEKILSFFENWFEEHNILGDAKAFKAPDVAIILGVSQPILDIRLKESFKILEKYPDTLVIFSGGGFSTLKSESKYMKEKALAVGLKNPMVLESKSMDTLGNALFSKFELMRKKNISNINKILILTSRFHTPRAFHYFKRIFNTHHFSAIAAYGIPTNDHNLKKLTAHELISEYRAYSTLNIFKTHPNNPIDDQAILLKLFKNHPLYQNRFDILERYLKDS